MKLFTKEIDTKLFEQYLTGSDLENQMVVAKIFNPYGRGTWYLLNSDPEDPEYLWAIVDMDDIEVGSVNRSDLENIRIKPFMLGLERDLSFRQMNALELYEGLNEGKKYLKGGSVEAENKEMVLNNNKQIAHHTKEISAAVKNAKNVPAWVVAKVNRSATDLSDATHYMEGQGESYADGGGVGDKKMYEITFEDVFSFATAVKTAQLTDSQYQKAIQQMKNKDVVVDKFNERQGIREQLRIKEITPKFKTGGGVGDFKKVSFPEDKTYKYYVVDEDKYNYLTVQEDMFDKWKNANKFDKAEYYSEWIPKNEMVEIMKTGGGVEKSVLHLYKLTYPNGQYIVEDYNGGSMTPKEALEKMRISLRGFKSYKYASASSDSDNYKKWHTKKSIGYSNTEAWDEVFGKEKYEKGGGVEWDKDSDSIRTELGEFRVRITPQMQKGYYDVYVSANKKEIGKKYDVYGIANAKDIALEIISNSNKFDKGGSTKGWKHRKK